MSNDTNKNDHYFECCFITAQILMVILKGLGVLTLSWKMVFLPTLIYLLVMTFFLVMAFIIGFIFGVYVYFKK